MPRILYLSLEISHLKITASRSSIIKQQRIASRFTRMNNFSHLCRGWSGTAQDRECEQTSIFFLGESGVPLKRTQKHSRPWGIPLSRRLTIESWQRMGRFFQENVTFVFIRFISYVFNEQSVPQKFSYWFIISIIVMAFFKNCVSNTVSNC